MKQYRILTDVIDFPKEIPLIKQMAQKGYLTYLPNIDLAIEIVKKFACDENNLVNEFGSNI